LKTIAILTTDKGEDLNESIRRKNEKESIFKLSECEKRVAGLSENFYTKLLNSIVNYMSNEHHLSILELSGLPLNSSHIQLLAKGLQNCTSIKILSLSRTIINDEGLKTLAVSLKHSSSIMELHFAGCGLTHESAIVLTELIKYQCLSREAEQWTNSLRPSITNTNSHAELFGVPLNLKQNSIKRLNLCNNNIGDIGMNSLFEIITEDLGLEAVDVQFNSITNEGLKDIDYLIKLNKTLIIFDLRNNNIDDELMKRIDNYLKENKELRNNQNPFSSSSKNKEFKMLDGVNPLSFSYHTKEIKITSNSEPSCEKLRSRFFPSVNPLLDKSKKKWSTFGPLKITDATTKSTKNINKNARSGSKKNLKSGLLSSSSSSSKTLRKPKIIYSNNVDSNDPIGSNKNKLNKKKSNIKLNKGKKENKKFRIACIDDVEIIDDTNKNHENTNEKNDRIDNTKKNTIKQEISEFENNNNNNNNNNFNIFDNSLYIPSQDNHYEDDEDENITTATTTHINTNYDDNDIINDINDGNTNNGNRDRSMTSINIAEIEDIKSENDDESEIESENLELINNTIRNQFLDEYDEDQLDQLTKQIIAEKQRNSLKKNHKSTKDHDHDTDKTNNPDDHHDNINTNNNNNDIKDNVRKSTNDDKDNDYDDDEDNNDYVPVKIEGNEIINKEKKDNNSLNRRDQDKVDNETNMMEENIIKTQNDNDNDNDHENQKENENVITHKIKNKNKEKIKEENKKDTESNNGRGPPLSNNSSNSTIDSKKYEEEIKTLEESINIDELDNDNNDNDDDNDNDNDSKLYEEEIKKLEESINMDELDDDNENYNKNNDNDNDDDNEDVIYVLPSKITMDNNSSYNESFLINKSNKIIEKSMELTDKLNDSMINTKDFENTTTTITNNNNNNNNNNNKKKSLKKNNSPKNNFPSSNKSSATSRKKLDNPESSTKHNKPDKENKSLNDSKDDIKSFPSPSSSSVLANNKKKSSSNNEDNSKGKMVKSRKNIHPPTNTSMISEKEKNKNSLRKSSSTEEKKKKKNENKSKDNDNDEGVDGDGDEDVTENENITGKGNDSEDYNEFIIIPGNTLPKNNDNNEASDTIPVSEKDKNKNKEKNKGKNGEESERNSHIHDKKIKNKDFNNNNNNNNCIINYGDEKDYLLPKNEKLSGKKKEFIYDTLNSLSEISDTIDTIENNLKSFNVEFIHLPNPPHPPPHHHHHHRHHQNQSQTLILPKAKSQEMIYDVSMLSSLAIRSDEDIQFTLLSITNSLREIQNQTLQDMLESSHFLKPIILSLRSIIIYSKHLLKILNIFIEKKNRQRERNKLIKTRSNPNLYKSELGSHEVTTDTKVIKKSVDPTTNHNNNNNSNNDDNNNNSNSNNNADSNNNNDTKKKHEIKMHQIEKYKFYKSQINILLEVMESMINSYYSYMEKMEEND
jgi:hypothetical protein